MNKNVYFKIVFAFIVFISFTTIVKAQELPGDGIYPFIGANDNGDGTFTTQEGFFIMSAHNGSSAGGDSKVSVDPDGAFIPDGINTSYGTSYLEIKVSGGGNFKIVNAFIGEYESNPPSIATNAFYDIRAVGYANGNEIASTPYYDSRNAYEVQYDMDFSDFAGKEIDVFRIYYSWNTGTMQSSFNLVNMTIAAASTDPPEHSNAAPTDISLSSTTISHSAGTNAVVGTLSADDPDDGETFTYSLVPGTGDTDNASFNINGDQLRANNTTALSAGDKSIRVQVEDAGGAHHEEVFTITVTAAEPSVITAEQASLTATSAVLGGEVTADGGATVSERGIVWATTSNPTTSSHKIAFSGTTGAFSQPVGLPANETIHVRAYATNTAGTAYGDDVTFVTPAADPPPGNALTFDGAGDFVEIGTASTFDARTMKTIEAWVKFGDLESEDPQEIISKSKLSNGLELIIYNGNLAVFAMGGTSPDPNISYPTSNLEANKWYHVAATHNGANSELRLYVNGELVGTTQTHVAMTDSGEPLHLGKWNPPEADPDRTNRYFKGSLDEVRIWNVERTQAQIKADMYHEIDPLSAGLLVYYNFDQGIPGGNNVGLTTLYDRTANNNDGDLNNFALNGTTSNWTASYAMVRPVATAADAINATGFTAHWLAPVYGGATDKYLLDVATNPTFTSIISEYNGKDVGNVLSAQVTGLVTGTTYYYRVRAQKGADISSYSEAIEVVPQNSINPDANGILYVKKGSSGDGSSWGSALGELADALSGAKTLNNTTPETVTRIWVAEGTYYPKDEVGGTGERYRAFQLQNNLAVYGGFAGDEDPETFDLASRNFADNETKLSGDIDGNGTLDNNNAYHVFYHPSGLNLNSTAILDGVTLTEGNANGSSEASVGGGMSNLSSAPVLTNVTISGNIAQSNGGGMYNSGYSSPVLTNVTISGNIAQSDGGGMYNSGYSFPVLTNVTISGNTATYGGGGIYCDGSSFPLIQNSIIWGNGISQNYAGNIDASSNHNYIQGLTNHHGDEDYTAADFFTNPQQATDGSPTTAGDYTLKAGSPAINTGDNTLYDTGVYGAADLAGNARIFDGTIDAGAYERQMKQQEISFTGLTDNMVTVVYGDGDFNPATAVTTVSYTVPAANGVAEIADGKIHILGAGEIDLTVTAAGNSEYDPATATKVLKVNKKELIAKADDKSKDYDGMVFNPSNYSVSYSGFIDGEDAGNVSITGSPVYGGTSQAAINAGDYAISVGVSGLSAANYSFTSGADGTLSIEKVTLTAKADDKSKDYDGMVFNPSSYSVSYSGFIDGEDAANVTITGTPVYGGTSQTAVNAGDYVISIDVSGLSAANYSFTSGADGTLSIEKKELTAKADDKSKGYDGEVFNPSGYTVSYSGFIDGEDAGNVIITGTPAYGGTSQTAVNAGDYAISVGVSGLSAANYSFTSGADGTLSIEKKELTAKADDKSKGYDGEVFNPSGYTVSYSGFIDGEDAGNVIITGTPAYGGTSQAAVNAGEYAISIDVSGLSAANYSFTSGADGTLSIEKKELTAKADDKSKGYDGEVFNPSGYTVSYSGFIDGEDAGNVIITGTPAYGGTSQAAVNAGEYAISIDVSGLSAANYSFTSGADGTLSIEKVTLTAKADDKSKGYDGEVFNPSGYTVSYSGFIDGEDAGNVIITGSPVYGGTSQAAVNAGEYAISIDVSGLSAANYSFTSGADGTLSIEKVTLTAKADDKSKGYDGEVFNPSGYTVSYSGFIDGEDAANVTITGSPVYGGTSQAAVNAGEYAISIDVSGLSAANYSFTSGADGTLSIEKVTLTAKADDKSKDYDGEVFNPSGYTVSYSGFIDGEDAANVTITGSPVYGGTSQAAVNAGDYAISIDVSGLSAANYSFTSGADGTLSIEKVTLTAKADDKLKVYDGEVFNPSGYTVSYSGFIDGEDAGNVTITGSPVYGGTSQAAVNAGDYAISIDVSGLSAANYSFTSGADGTLSIEKKELTAKADDKSKDYDGMVFNPSNYSVSYSGFIDGEDAGNVTITGSPVYGGTSQAAVNAGDYAISIDVSGLSASNYSFTSGTDGTLNINKALLTVTATGPSKIYGTALTAGTSTINFTAGTAQNGEAVTGVTLTLDAAGLSATTAAGAAYSVTPSLATGTGGFLENNYDITYVSFNGTVDKATLTVTATGPSKIYGTALMAGTSTINFTAGTAQHGEAVTGVTLTPDAAGLSATTAAGATYSVTPSLATGTGGFLENNYDITYVPFNGTVDKATLTVTATGPSKIYGTSLTAGTSTINFTAGTAQHGEAVTGITLTPDAAGLSATTAAGAAYSVTPSLATGTGGFREDNYDITYMPFNGSVTKAALTITAENKEKFTGTANPPLTVSYSGFVNGEGAGVLSSLPVASTSANTGSPAGSYPITASGASAANYNISYEDGVLTVISGAPAGVSLAQSTLYENSPAGSLAGTLSSASDDPGATFSFALIPGAGDTDNSLFSISGNKLITAGPLNYEQKESYRVRVRSTTQYGQTAEQELTISLKDVNEAPELDAVADQVICFTDAPQTIQLSGINAGPESGQSVSLSVLAGNAGLFEELGINNSGLLSYRIKQGESGSSTISITVKDDGGTANGGVDSFTRSFTLTVNPLPVVTISNDKGRTELSKGETLVLTASGGTAYSWSGASGMISGQNSAVLTVRPSVTTTYRVNVTTASGCETFREITVNVQEDYIVLKGTNILSPNGDGKNDKFIISNIDMYPNNEVKIFDRAGRLLYGKANYTDEWDGTFQGSPLAEGTYYYIVDFGPGKMKLKGFITIVRD